MNLRSPTSDRHSSRCQDRFEESRVKMTLNAFGLDDLKWPMLLEHQEKYGDRRLTFVGFRSMFPDFPVLLQALYRGGVGERMDVASLFRRFHQLFLSDEYISTFVRFGKEAAGRPIALVIPFGGLRSGMAIHNGSFDSGANRFLHRIPGDVPPYQLTAEPFRTFLRYLARGRWSPHLQTQEEVPVTSADVGSVPAVVAPWMSRLLGTGPAFAVYVWLTGLLDSSSPRHQDCVARAPGGDRYVAVTQAQLSEFTGLHQSAVKRGLDDLRKRAFVTTARAGGRTLITLHPPQICDEQ